MKFDKFWILPLSKILKKNEVIIAITSSMNPSVKIQIAQYCLYFSIQVSFFHIQFAMHMWTLKDFILFSKLECVIVIGCIGVLT